MENNSCPNHGLLFNFKCFSDIFVFKKNFKNWYQREKCWYEIFLFFYFRHILQLTMDCVSVGFVFFSCCFFCGLLFLFLAQRWRALSIFWQKQETVFLGPAYIRKGWSLSTKIRITATLFFSLALRKYYNNTEFE